ncbi:MAG: hypothetical protein AAF745_17890, partial [Planctomycetota bacterium]
MSDISNEFVIGDDNYQEHLDVEVDGVRIGGEEQGFGLIARDPVDFPQGYGSGVRKFDGPLIPWEEFPERIREMEARKMRLSDIRNRRGPNGGRIPSTNQGTEGFCWNYSVTSSSMLVRGKANMPFVMLSGHANAWVIKNGRNQGGWSPQGAERAVSHGIPSVDFWPERSMSRSHNNTQTWENAKKHRIIEGWADLSLSIYDRNLTAQQVLTCLCQLNPVTLDLMWWRHSVTGMDPLDVYPNRS